MNIDISLLSKKYKVTRLTEGDIDEIFKLCVKNSLYYQYYPPEPTKEDIIKDFSALPRGIDYSNKYYLGFYKEEKLIAVLDLIIGYPNSRAAFIGFFMTAVSVQNSGVGSQIIQDILDFLKSSGLYESQLAWIKGNEQAEHFWLKNGFVPLKETRSDTEALVILAQKIL